MRNAIQLYDPSAKSGDSGIDQLGAVGLERGERASLIPTHQPAVAGNIRAQNCGSLRSMPSRTMGASPGLFGLWMTV